MKRLGTGLLVLGLLLNILAASWVAFGGDPVDEIRMIVVAPESRPQHLLQTTLFRGAHAVAGAIAPGVPDFAGPQALNALAGAIAAVLLAAFLRRTGASWEIAGFLGVFWLLSRTPWLHARTAETGITAMPLVLGAFLLAWGRAGSVASARRVAAASLLLAAAVWLSLGFVVLVPAFLVAVALGRPAGRGLAGGGPPGRGLNRRSLTVALGVLAVAGPLPFLGAAGQAGVRDAAGFLAWLTTHPDGSGLGAPGGIVSALRSVTGVARLVFPESAGETAVKAALTGAEVRVGGAAVFTLVRNLAALAGLTLAAAVGARRAWRAGAGSGPRRLAVVAATAIGAVGAFNLRWLGSDPQFWLPAYPFLLALAAAAATSVTTAATHRFRPVLRAAAVAVLVFLGVTNGPGGPPSPLFPRGGPDWRGAEALAAELPARSVIWIPMRSRTPFEFVPYFRDDVEIVDLSYTAPRDLAGDAFRAWLGQSLEAARRQDRPVFVDGFRDPVPAAVLGAWGFVANTRHVTREDLLPPGVTPTADPGAPERLTRLR